MGKKVSIVYLAAGIARRFEGRIKQFAAVGPERESLIEVSMKQASGAGFSEIIFVISDKTEMPFKKRFGYEFQGKPIKYAKQEFNPEKRDRPWGTVDALLSAAELIDSPFVVCNSDDIYGGDSFKTLVNHLKTSDTAASLGYRLMDVLPDTGAVNRGIFEVSGDSFVLRLFEAYDIEKNKIPKNLSPDAQCSMNIFALHQDTIGMLQIMFEDFKEIHKGDRKAEFLLSDALGILMREKKIKMKLYSANDKWVGITRPEDVEITRKLINKHYKREIV